MLDQLNDLFPQQVTLETVNSKEQRDLSGRPVFHAPQVFQARIVGRLENVIDNFGETQVSKYRVYINGTPIISPNSRISLPDGYAPPHPKILSTALFPDEHGLHHTVIYLG